jgi:hypothetical protein
MWFAYLKSDQGSEIQVNLPYKTEFNNNDWNDDPFNMVSVFSKMLLQAPENAHFVYMQVISRRKSIVGPPN